MDTWFHFIRDIIAKGRVTLFKIHTSKNHVDFLTKQYMVLSSCCAMIVSTSHEKGSTPGNFAYVPHKTEVQEMELVFKSESTN